MAIYVIADLHLSFAQNKPMSVFGDNWMNHEEKIQSNWIDNVKEEDVVVLPGDFSWSMYLEESKADFEYLNKLPGKKVLLKGNHDYWWETLTKMKKFLKENSFSNIDFIYNTAYECENAILVGTKGWSPSDDKLDLKLLNRELARLELSINEAEKINLQLEKEGKEIKPIIAFIHYPPISDLKHKDNNYFIKLLKKYNIEKCFYGHLHASSINNAVEGNIDGIELKLISADKLDFKLFKIQD